jgi:hypothetical protein
MNLFSQPDFYKASRLAPWSNGQHSTGRIQRSNAKESRTDAGREYSTGQAIRIGGIAKDGFVFVNLFVHHSPVGSHRELNHEKD